MKRSELKQLIREVVSEVYGSPKLDDIDIIKGETIIAVEGKVKDESMVLRCASGNYYDISVDYDYGNDSHAFISDIDLAGVIGKELVDAHHDGKDSYGVTLIFVAANGAKGTITIQHDHNGYYGFSYHVNKMKS